MFRFDDNSNELEIKFPVFIALNRVISHKLDRFCNISLQFKQKLHFA